MMKQSPKVIFFGNERLATGVTTTAPTLRALIAAGIEVCALVVNNSDAVSRSGRKVEIIEVANEHNIPVIVPTKLPEIEDDLRAYGADVGVLVAFGKMVPDSIIDVFPSGIINIHPSDLPKHRGPTPIESVILSGETETAVSLMMLVKAMDAGPVYVKRTYSVPAQIGKQELANDLLEIGSKLVVQHLSGIVNGLLVPEPQNDADATYDSLISKQDNVLNFELAAEQLERQIRAHAGWPKSIAEVGKYTLIVTHADVVNTSGKPGTFQATKKELLVFCKKDALSLKMVQPPNKKEMPIEAFLAGYQL